ncbi:MAG: GAF domain-containing protein [Anaerolineales bacterium]|nr:GAF domain-containing protein [Anaerolineales bacterium]
MDHDPLLFSEDHSPGGGHEATLLHAINQAVAELQRSAYSEENVLRAFSAQMDRLKLIGLISILDDSKENLVIRTTVHSAYNLETFERISGGKIQDFKFQWQKVDAFKQVMLTGQTLFLPNPAQLISQITPQNARFLLKGLLDMLGGMPVILAPLTIEKDTQGILIVAAPELLQSDLPAFEAFANHIAIALTNARLFESLRQAEVKYRTLFEASTDAIFLETLEGKVLDCNTTACEMFGYSREELRELTVADLVPEAISIKLEDVIRQELASGGAFLQALNKRKDGSLFPVEVNTRLVKIGERELAVVYVRDISQRKQTEDQLREAQAALSHRVEELASLYDVVLEVTATHDLPTLLETIVERATRLLDGSGGGLYLCEPERNEARCVVSYHTKRDYTGTTLKYGEGVAGQVAQEGKPLIIDDYRTWAGRAAVYEQEQPFQAVISTPITWQNQVTGVLNVLDSETRHFTQEESKLLSLFANQAAVAIENARLLESERRRRQEAEILHQAARTLTSTLDLESVLENILTHLEKVVQYDSAAVFLLQDGHVHCQAARGQPLLEAVIGQDFPADNALVAEIRRNKRSLILEDAHLDPRFESWGGTHYVRSWMGVPMIVHDEVIGYLTCDHRQAGIYRLEDATLAEVFANQAAIAIENARLFEAERSQLLLAQTLQEIGALLTSESSLDQVLERILDLLGQVVEYDTASIQLLDSEDKMFLAAGRGFEDIEVARQTVYELSDHIRGFQFAENKLVIIPDTHADERWIITPESAYIRSWIGTPLLVKGRFIGSLSVDHRKVNAYSESVGETVMAFANQAAIAIENARLFEAERQRVAELQAVRAASLSLTASIELPQVLDSILRSTLKLLPEAQNGHIFLYNPNDGGRLSFGAALWTEGPKSRPWSEPRPHGLTHTVARTGEMIVVPDMRKHPLFEGAPPGWTGAIVGYPLKIGPRVVGVMNVSFRQPHRILDSELRMLRLLGDQAAIAIENARLYEQAATERRHLGLLHDLSREITSSLEPDEIFRRAAVLTCQALSGILGEAFLYLPDEDRLSLRAIFGEHGSTPEIADALLNMRPGKGLTGWVAQNRQAVYVGDVNQDERWIYIPGLDDDARSAIIAPILAEEQLLGILSVLHSQTNAFIPEHLELMKTICQEVGLALSNASRYQQVQRRLTEITLIQKLTQAFNQRLEVQTLLDEVAAQLNNQLGYSQITIFLVEADNLALKAWSGQPPKEYSYPLSRGIIGRVVREGQAALVPDVSSDPDYYLHPGEKYVAELAVPIFRDEKVIGVISIQSEQIGQLTGQDRELLEVLAGQVSVALENAELYERIHQHAEELEHTVAQRTAELTELYKLSREIGYPLSYQEMLKLLLRRLHKAARCDLALSCLVTDDSCLMLAETSRPLSSSTLSDLHSRWLENQAKLLRKALQSKGIDYEVIRADDFDEHRPAIERIESVIQAPITIESQTVGILIASSEAPNAFGPEQEHLLTTFASQASSAAARLSTILSAQQRQLESLVEHLPVGVSLLDADFRVLVSNPLGREIASLLNAGQDGSPEIIRRLGAYSLRDLIERESSQLPVEITLEGPPRRIFMIQIRPAGDPVDGDRPHWVLTMNDITQERENLLRIQIQERLATVGQLAAGIAHDFNNIMAAILVYTDLLRYDPVIPDSSKEKLTIIQQQVERASSLIRQILDFSRRSVMEQSALDLLPLVKELEKMLARILPETIQLELVYQLEPYWVKGDPTRLQQVFMNLALNARDAMPNGGKLHFELSKVEVLPSDVEPIPETPPGNWVHILVSDTGGGIPMEVREHIFEPFYTTKPVGEGTGLGLAQVYGIVKQHNGYINVHSQTGQGTSFSIHLPALQTMSETKRQQDAAPLVSVSGKGQTVLVVEDDITTRQALQALLEAYDYRVLTAPNGVQALQVMGNVEHPVDLLISDIVMPEMGGVALYNVVRDRYPGVKILFVTGHPLEEASQALLEEGKIHWLQKPFSAPQFTQMVKKLLEGDG